MHGHDGFGTRRDAVLNIGGVDIAGGVLNVGKNGGCAGLHYSYRRGDKCLRSQNYLISASYSGNFQGQMQRTGATVEGRRVQYA